MSLPICPMVQLLYIVVTVGNENLEQRSKTEASCKINYYFSDLIIKLQNWNKNTDINFFFNSDTCLFVNSSINGSQMLPGCRSIKI